MVKVVIKPQSPPQLCPGVPARLRVRVHHLPLVLLVLHLEDDDDDHHNDVRRETIMSEARDHQ